MIASTDTHGNTASASIELAAHDAARFASRPEDELLVLAAALNGWLELISDVDPDWVADRRIAGAIGAVRQVATRDGVDPSALADAILALEDDRGVLDAITEADAFRHFPPAVAAAAARRFGGRERLGRAIDATRRIDHFARAGDLASAATAALELVELEATGSSSRARGIPLSELMRSDPCDEPLEVLRTGLPWWDGMMPDGGFRRGDKVIVGGEPGTGKTTLALNFVLGVLEQSRDASVVWAAGEMSPKALRNRLLTNACDLARGVLSRPWAKLSPLQAQAKRDGIERLHDVADRLVILEGPLTPAVIEAEVRAAKPDILVVDYLQLVGSDDPGLGAMERVEAALRSVVSLAQQHGLVAIVLSSSSKPTSGAGLDPWSAFRSSAEIRFAADLAYFGVQDPETRREGVRGIERVEVTWRCVKARDGRPSDIRTTLLGELARFEGAA